MNSSPLPLRAVLLVSIIAVTYAQAPDGHCCVALAGTKPVVEACAFCATLENFVCRSSVSPWTGSVSSTSVDCVSFAFANETACLAAPGAQEWITSSNFSGAGCPKTVTAYPSPPPTPPPPPFAPGTDGSCCVAFYGEKDADADCDLCVSHGFICRDHELYHPYDNEDNKKDCLSPSNTTTEAECFALGLTWVTTPNAYGVQCPMFYASALPPPPPPTPPPTPPKPPPPSTANTTSPPPPPSTANTTSPPPPPSTANTTSPPPPPSPPPKLVTDDDDDAAGLAGILVTLVATTFNTLFSW